MSKFEKFERVYRDAKDGYEDAQFDLACMFFSGYGTSRDDQEGQKWMVSAARIGSKEARSYLKNT